MPLNRHSPRPTGGARSTLPVRLELETHADRLTDDTAAAAAEYLRLEALAAAARDRWATLDRERAAVERALLELPDLVPTAPAAAAAQAA